MLKPFHRRTISLLALLLGLTGSYVGCDKDKSEDEEREQLSLKIAAKQSAAAEKFAPPPATEEAILDALVLALEGQDIKALKRLVAPELAADLERMHRADPARLWDKSRRFVANIRSGIKIQHRDDSTRGVWRVLVKFGNGQVEQMKFARIDGRVLIMAL
jgi:hypothetical protein